MQTQNCSACGGPIALGSVECSYCGAQQASASRQPQPVQQASVTATIHMNTPPMNQGMQTHVPPGANGQMFTPMHQAQPPHHYQPPYPQYPHPPYAQHPPYVYRKLKNKVLAGLLAIFLGWLGIHKFYLGRPVQGIVYILFCWTYLPALLGLIEGIVYLSMQEQNFHAKYSR